MSYNVFLNFLKVNVSLPDSVAPAVPASHWPHSHLRVRRSALHWSLRQPSLRTGPLPSTHACKAPMSPWAVAGTHFDVKQGDISHEGQGTVSSYELNHIIRATELPQALTLLLKESPKKLSPAATSRTRWTPRPGWPRIQTLGLAVTTLHSNNTMTCL